MIAGSRPAINVSALVTFRTMMEPITATIPIMMIPKTRPILSTLARLCITGLLQTGAAAPVHLHKRDQLHRSSSSFRRAWLFRIKLPCATMANVMNLAAMGQPFQSAIHPDPEPSR
jgi:hypothetical protein